MIITEAFQMDSANPSSIPFSPRQCYAALLSKNSEYDGIVYFGIRTTGIFCRPTCSARKPKFENCEFFPTSQLALLAGYRPCKRCRPLDLPGKTSTAIQQLINAVEEKPDHRWTDEDFRRVGIDSSTARRQFKKRFGMTFVAYARSRRMGIAVKLIRDGESVISAQLNSGYQSGSGFRDAFSRILGVPPQGFSGKVLQVSWMDTELGPMIAIASDTSLLLLEFTDRRGLENEIIQLRNRTRSAIVPGQNEILKSLRVDLQCYFSGQRLTFQTPIELIGTEFQKRVWSELLQIPPGEVRSYSEQAQQIDKPTAVRAVARANGANKLALIVPCHRVIGANGGLTGYAGGLVRKQWLLDHEQKYR